MHLALLLAPRTCHHPLPCTPPSFTVQQKFGLDSSEDLTFGLICIMLLDFLYLFIASALLGMAFGLITAYCLRTFHFHHVSQVGSLGWQHQGAVAGGHDGVAHAEGPGCMADPKRLPAPHQCLAALHVLLPVLLFAGGGTDWHDCLLGVPCG